MRKQLLYTLIGCVGAFILLGGIKTIQIRAAIANSSSFAPPPDAVTTMKVALKDFFQAESFVGEIRGDQAAILKIEESGNVAETGFDSGESVKAGALLLSLDTGVEKGNLDAARAKRRLAELELQRKQSLFDQKVISPSERDTAKAMFDQADGEARSLEAMIRRKSIVAPFDGITGVRQASVGNWIQAGTPVTTIRGMHPLYVLFRVPQGKSEILKAGMIAEIISERGASKVMAHITGIDSVFDESSRSAWVKATIDQVSHDKETQTNSAIIPGAFVKVRVTTDVKQSGYRIPSSSIQFAPYGNSVFVVEAPKEPKLPTTVRQQFIKIGEMQDNFVVISDGLKEGEEIVTSGTFKLMPGGAVNVQNTIDPNELANKESSDS